VYGDGRGVPKDLARAASFLEQACAAGARPACVQHAWALARGEGLVKDEPKAMAALDSLCTDKVFAACTRLAALYGNKPGASGRARAQGLLAAACEGGEQDACRMAKGLN